jgi:S-methyl-1-thioxylulose 5-phosphate methylthiotransferase
VIAQRRSRLIRSRGTAWDGVPISQYKDASTRHRNVTRCELVGGAEGEDGLGFVVRYFEVAAGGFSSLERHDHAHAVMVIRGHGVVVLDESAHSVAPLDCVYVAPGSLHQFQASPHEALGFLCIVDRVRDRGVLPPNEEIARLRSMGVPVRPDGDEGDV